MKTKNIALFAMLTAVALILSYVESLIPVLVAVPGVKLGITNIVVIFALYRLGTKEAAALSLLRVVLVSFLFGNAFSFLYSLAGAILSLAVMILLKKSDKFSATGVSVAGAVFHNVGQILVAIVVLSTEKLVLYLPVLAVTGVLAGVVTGLAASVLLKRVPESL